MMELETFIIGGEEVKVPSIYYLTDEQLTQYHEEQREIENEYNSKIGVILGLPPCKIYSPEFIIRFTRLFKNHNLYYDYVPQSSVYYDRRITSFYLEYGLKKIDGWISRQIREGSKYSKEELKDIILTNPHLHPIVRNDLYHNLMNFI